MSQPRQRLQLRRAVPRSLQSIWHMLSWLLSALSGLLSAKAQWGASTALRGGPIEKSDARYNILAFGDSLTEGFYASGFRFHPYSFKLQELLAGNSYSAKVYERGNSGERVVRGMDGRLPALLQHFERNDVKLSWVVIMGGTNDLGYGVDHRTVFAGLQSLYAACQAHGARVLALTVLQNAGSKGGAVDERTRLNELIRATPSAPGGSYEHVTVLDVEGRLPFPLTPEDGEAMALWDDFVHLKPAGYDILGQMVYDALKERLEK